MVHTNITPNSQNSSSKLLTQPWPTIPKSALNVIPTLSVRRQSLPKPHKTMQSIICLNSVCYSSTNKVAELSLISFLINCYTPTSSPNMP